VAGYGRYRDTYFLKRAIHQSHRWVRKEDRLDSKVMITSLSEVMDTKTRTGREQGSRK
jgi:hypothetical protein